MSSGEMTQFHQPFPPGPPARAETMPMPAEPQPGSAESLAQFARDEFMRVRQSVGRQSIDGGLDMYSRLARGETLPEQRGWLDLYFEASRDVPTKIVRHPDGTSTIRWGRGLDLVLEQVASAKKVLAQARHRRPNREPEHVRGDLLRGAAAFAGGRAAALAAKNGPAEQTAGGANTNGKDNGADTIVLTLQTNQPGADKTMVLPRYGQDDTPTAPMPVVPARDVGDPERTMLINKGYPNGVVYNDNPRPGVEEPTVPLRPPVAENDPDSTQPIQPADADQPPTRYLAQAEATLARLTDPRQAGHRGNEGSTGPLDPNLPKTHVRLR